MSTQKTNPEKKTTDSQSLTKLKSKAAAASQKVLSAKKAARLNAREK